MTTRPNTQPSPLLQVDPDWVAGWVQQLAALFPEREPGRLSAEGIANRWARSAFHEGVFTGNAMRVATKEEADQHAVDLVLRWTAVEDMRVVESDDPVNYEIKDNELRSPR